MRWPLALPLFLGGCYLGPQGITYPAPRPLGGTDIVYPTAAGLGGFAGLCRARTAPGASRAAVAFRAEGVAYCFQAPASGDNSGCVSVNGLGGSGSLIFTVLVGGVGLRQARADLGGPGGTATAAAETADAGYAGSAAEAGAGVAPLNPGAATLVYPVPRQSLAFRFAWPCDPRASYRLTLSGVAPDGRVVQAPTVAFEPVSETVQRYLD